MGMSSPSQLHGSAEAPGFPDEALVSEMERIVEPAILHLPGGRIAYVNSAAEQLSDLRVVGLPMIDLVQRSASRAVDGSRLLPGDLPFARALRGEVVDQGERIEIVLLGLSVYRALVTSNPIIRDGKVVAAFSVWHDVDRDLQDLVDGL